MPVKIKPMIETRGRKAHPQTLTEEDILLIQNALLERERLRSELEWIEKRKRKIIRDRKQLTMKSLAQKFDCTEHAIYRVTIK